MQTAGIVLIVKPHGTTYSSVGTGFFVGTSSLLLTCYHVVKKTDYLNTGVVEFMFEGNPQVFTARLDVYDADHDIAILNAEANVGEGYYLLRDEEYKSAFCTLGFPEGSNSGVTAHPLYERTTPDDLIELTDANEICRGFSGAPLFDEADSLVVGIIKAVPSTIRQEGSLLSSARAIPIEKAIQLFPDKLKEHVRPRPQKGSHSSAIPSDSGRLSPELHDLAEKTFLELMDIWLDRTRVKSPSRVNSEYIVVEFPSLSQGMPHIRTFWHIMSSSSNISRHYNIGINSNCFHLELSHDTICSLRESLQQDAHHYLALAHKRDGDDLYDLRRYAPLQRFDWYCVDLNQQFNSGETYVVVPEQNRLNLSTFSLLWSSLWVEKTYSPLLSRSVVETPRLIELISRVFPRAGERVTEFENWEALSKKMQMLGADIDKDVLSRIYLPLAVGTLLKDITKTLYVKASSLKTIQAYCPESLYGNVNLWLFDRSYRKFMYASGQVVDADRQGNNLRILPLPDEPDKIPILIKVCLWHVMLLYATLNVEVRIIYCPKYDAGIDHSYYGGGIDYFPWLSFSDDGVTFMIESNTSAVKGSHRDFLNKHMKDVYISPTNGDLIATSNYFKLTPAELETAPNCPALLFPKEDRFIEYPRNVFGKSVISSLQALRSKLA